MADWQPIETAPTSGESVLLICADAYSPQACIGWFRADSWHHYSRPSEKWHGGVCKWFPTHWMPLPQPPGVGAARAEAERGNWSSHAMAAALDQRDAARADARELLEALKALTLYHDVPDEAQDPVVLPLLDAAFKAIAKAAPEKESER